MGKFNNIKVGDLVMLRVWRGYVTDEPNRFLEAIVTSVAKSTFKINITSHSYNMEDGEVYHQKWVHSHILPYDKERIEKSKEEWELYRHRCSLLLSIQKMKEEIDMHHVSIGELEELQKTLWSIYHKQQEKKNGH